MKQKLEEVWDEHMLALTEVERVKQDIDNAMMCKGILQASLEENGDKIDDQLSEIRNAIYQDQVTRDECSLTTSMETSDAGPNEGSGHATGFGKGEGGDTVDAMDGGIEDGGHDAGNGGLPSFKFAGFSNDAFHAEMDRRAEFVRHQAAEMERLDAQMKRRQAAGNF